MLCFIIFIEKTEFIETIIDDKNNINNINITIKLSIHNNPLYNIIPLSKKLLKKLLYKIIKELININTDILEYKIELSRLLLTALDIIKDIIE
jgi:hypothetical protein